MRRDSTAIRSRRRCAATAVCAAGAALVGTLLPVRAAGLRVNDTASMPRGFWRVVAADAPLRRGEIVVVCPPDTVPIREGVVRGYIPAGACPGGTAPLLKPVAAVAGDVVTVTTAGFAVDDRPVASCQPVANCEPLLRDSTGRALRAMPVGTYPVAPGTIWLLSGHDPRSFDSRYFGPVPAANIQGVARPLWVLG